MYLRPKVTGATVFFTVNLADRESDLLIREIETLRGAVKATKQERPFGIDAWVVLPDHLHCIWRLPFGDRDYGTRWGAIKSRFSRAVASSGRVGFYPTDGSREVRGKVGWNPTLRSASKRQKGESGIWQRRFWEHHIRDETDYHMHLRYCWMNPVKHGLVERPEDWEYSSVHFDERFCGVVRFMTRNFKRR